MTALLALALSPLALADDPQYRKLTLVDGRELTAEILSTEPQGLLLRMPQGRALLSFELLRDMVPTDQAAYDAQPDWVVWVELPEVYQAQAEELLDAIPGVEGCRAGIGGDVSPSMASEIVGCSTIDCIAQKSASTSWKWIIKGDETATGELLLVSRTNHSTTSGQKVALASTTRDDFWYAFHEILDLQRPTEPAPKGASNVKPPSRSGDEGRIIAMSFVPVPGLPSLLEKDAVGVATAMGIVVPSTAIWVGAVGQTGQSGAEFGALSFAGFYAATVVANQVTGLRSLEKRKTKVSVLPAPGGSTVAVGGTF